MLTTDNAHKTYGIFTRQFGHKSVGSFAIFSVCRWVHSAYFRSLQIDLVLAMVPYCGSG